MCQTHKLANWNSLKEVQENSCFRASAFHKARRYPFVIGWIVICCWPKLGGPCGQGQSCTKHLFAKPFPRSAQLSRSRCVLIPQINCFNRCVFVVVFVFIFVFFYLVFPPSQLSRDRCVLLLWYVAYRGNALMPCILKSIPSLCCK